MRCEYCDCEVTTYPDNGICVHCGGKLPPKPVQMQPSAQVQPLVQRVEHVHHVHHVALVPGVNCCPKCRSNLLVHAKRGFRWGLGIFGFFLIPFFGLLLGFIGSGKPCLRCNACGHKWDRK